MPRVAVAGAGRARLRPAESAGPACGRRGPQPRRPARRPHAPPPARPVQPPRAQRYRAARVAPAVGRSFGREGQPSLPTAVVAIAAQLPPNVGAKRSPPQLPNPNPRGACQGSRPHHSRRAVELQHRQNAVNDGVAQPEPKLLQHVLEGARGHVRAVAGALHEALQDPEAHPLFWGAHDELRVHGARLFGPGGAGAPPPAGAPPNCKPLAAAGLCRAGQQSRAGRASRQRRSSRGVVTMLAAGGCTPSQVEDPALLPPSRPPVPACFLVARASRTAPSRSPSSTRPSRQMRTSSPFTSAISGEQRPGRPRPPHKGGGAIHLPEPGGADLKVPAGRARRPAEPRKWWAIGRQSPRTLPSRAKGDRRGASGRSRGLAARARGREPVPRGRGRCRDAPSSSPTVTGVGSDSSGDSSDYPLRPGAATAAPPSLGAKVSPNGGAVTRLGGLVGVSGAACAVDGSLGSKAVGCFAPCQCGVAGRLSRPVPGSSRARPRPDVVARRVRRCSRVFRRRLPASWPRTGREKLPPARSAALFHSHPRRWCKRASDSASSPPPVASAR